MQTYGLKAGAICYLFVSSTVAWALDPPSQQQPILAAPVVGAKNPLVQFKSGRDALRIGVREYNSGDKAGAIRALEFAAADGQALALWRLGRMYCDGDGVTRDDLKAFEIFSKLTDQYAGVPPDSSIAPIASSAFVALGGYYLKGIAGSYVAQDFSRAREMFHYAATYFSNPDAQYSLARIYIDGTGVEKNPRLAARWLKLAAAKGHYSSQAILGYLLINGEGVSRQKAQGFMWLTVARDAALDAHASTKDSWIFELYNNAEKTLPDSERKLALSYLENFDRE